MNEHVEGQGTAVGDQAPRPEHGAWVVVIYNGLSRQVEYRPHELVIEIRARSMVAFGINQNQHLLALWTEAGAELPDDKTASEAGVRPHEQLLLRPSTVRGGSRA